MDVGGAPGESSWDFELALPEVYVPLDLELEANQLRAAAARLVDERARVDRLVAGRRAEWVNHVVDFWEDVRERDAVDAWTMVYEVKGLPVRAYLLASVVERYHPTDVDAEIRSLESELAVAREGDAGERHVSVVQLHAGPVVRMRTLAEIELWKRRALILDVVQYWVPVPREPDILLLSFSTPELVVADILAEIADDIAQSLRFTP